MDNVQSLAVFFYGFPYPLSQVYWGNAAQILSPHDKNIQAAILDNLTPHPDAFTPPDPGHPLLRNVYEEIHGLYASKLPLYHTADENSKLQSCVVYTAMHGVGHPYILQSWLTAGFPRDKLLVVLEQRYDAEDHDWSMP